MCFVSCHNLLLCRFLEWGVPENRAFSDRVCSDDRVKVKTLQNWEQHRRNHTGAAAALLTIFDRAPDVAVKALHKAA
jgi:hypothetical protein